MLDSALQARRLFWESLFMLRTVPPEVSGGGSESCLLR